MLFFLFFLFKQKTAYEMRISDWSSDVCSSDLVRVHDLHVDAVEVHVLEDLLGIALGRAAAGLAVAGDGPTLVAGRVQPAEHAGAVLHPGLVELEVLLPDPATAQVLGQAGLDQVDGPAGGPAARHHKHTHSTKDAW